MFFFSREKYMNLNTALNTFKNANKTHAELLREHSKKLNTIRKYDMYGYTMVPQRPMSQSASRINASMNARRRQLARELENLQTRMHAQNIRMRNAYRVIERSVPSMVQLPFQHITPQNKGVVRRVIATQNMLKELASTRRALRVINQWKGQATARKTRSAYISLTRKHVPGNIAKNIVSRALREN